MTRRLRIEIGVPAEEIEARTGQASDGSRTLLCRDVHDFVSVLTPQMLRVLKAVADGPPMSERDLAARLNRNQEAVLTDLARLMGLGLVRPRHGKAVLWADEES